MAELTLEPYAVVQHWHLPGAEGRWEAILAEYLQTLARRCSAAGPAVIGHIKALALFSGEGYLRVSVVAANLPATVAGAVPPGCTDLELTLNVLVYGLERTLIERVTSETSNEIATQWKGAITHTDQRQAGPHVHQSNHQDA